MLNFIQTLQSNLHTARSVCAYSDVVTTMSGQHVMGQPLPNDHAISPHHMQYKVWYQRLGLQVGREKEDIVTLAQHFPQPY